MISKVEVSNGFYFYFREKYKAYYERKKWINAGGNPAVRREGVWTIPYLPGNGFRRADPEVISFSFIFALA